MVNCVGLLNNSRQVQIENIKMNDTHHSLSFSLISGEICNLLYLKEYNKEDVNKLIDDLNSKPYKAEIFVRKHVSFKVIFLFKYP